MTLAVTVVAAGPGWLDRELGVQLEGLQDFPGGPKELGSAGGDSRMQVSIFQGDAIFQQWQSKSFGKGLEKSRMPQNWVRQSLERWRCQRAGAEPHPGTKTRAWLLLKKEEKEKRSEQQQQKV